VTFKPIKHNSLDYQYEIGKKGRSLRGINCPEDCRKLLDMNRGQFNSFITAMSLQISGIRNVCFRILVIKKKKCVPRWYMLAFNKFLMTSLICIT